MPFDAELLMSRETWPLLAGLGLIAAYLAVSWFRDPVHARRLAERGPAYRDRYYREFHITMWALAAILTVLWLASGRSLASLGFNHEPGWGLAVAWTAAAVMGLYLVYSSIQIWRSPEWLEAASKQFESGGDLDLLTPETPRQARAFQGVALTAGFTEELACRGFLIGALAVFTPLWIAAPLSVLIFLAAHAYQGFAGMTRIVPISVVLTVMFVMSGSLWPGIVLHALVDMGGGVMMYRIASQRAGTDQPSAAS